MTERKEYKENVKVLMSLEPGDIVEFPYKPDYSHYGVYIGDGCVMHLVNEDTNITTFLKGAANLSSSSGACRKLFVKGSIVKQQFLDVVKDCTAKKNNYLDAEHKPYSREEIVERALSMEGQQGYDLFSFNCEHFATWCRNGKKESRELAKSIGIDALKGSRSVSGSSSKR